MFTVQDDLFTPITPLGFHPDTLQGYALDLSPCLTDGPGQVSNAVDVLHLRPDSQGLTGSVHRHIGVHSELSFCRWGTKTYARSVFTCSKALRGRWAGTDWFTHRTCCRDRCRELAGWAGAPWQLRQPPLRSSCLAPSPAPLDPHLTHVNTDMFCKPPIHRSPVKVPNRSGFVEILEWKLLEFFVLSSIC